MSAFRDELVSILPAIRGFARTFERDAARAEDLVQDTMMKAWANRDSYQPGTNMKAWLFTILRNVYISYYRKKRREVEDADGAIEGSLAEKGRQEGHMAMLQLKDAMSELPDDQREAIIMVGAAGFSYDEAAEIAGVAPGTIKSRVSRARVRLTELMGEVEGQAGEGATGDPTLISAGSIRQSAF